MAQVANSSSSDPKLSGTAKKQVHAALSRQEIEKKIKEVKEITGWNAEDIESSLLKYNYDSQLTIESILEGITFC